LGSDGKPLRAPLAEAPAGLDHQAARARPRPARRDRLPSRPHLAL